MLTGDALTTQDAFNILDGKIQDVALSPDTITHMDATRAGALAALKAGQRVYGWNQALGPLKDRPLNEGQQREFQVNVLRSHAAGVGTPLPIPVARLAMVIKANQMARGLEGVRPAVPERLLNLYNAGVTPVMPQLGSLGTGDLQPQAAEGLVAIGGQAPAWYRGTRGPASAILPRAELPATFVLEAGEALPIISGSTVVAALFLDALHRAMRMGSIAEGALALFMEATRAEMSSLDLRTHIERHIPEEVAVVKRLLALVHGSGWMTDAGRARFCDQSADAQNPLDEGDRIASTCGPRIQDAVSVRAAPHIFATWQHTIGDAALILGREINSSTSNPLIFPPARHHGYQFVMGGNWDGAMMGHTADSLNADIADVGVLSQELSARLLSHEWSYGLPDNLAGGKVGLNSGMVQLETVATALIPEMQTGAIPASVLSRPAKFGQEDHNTMAMASVRQLEANINRLQTVLAVQLIMSAQGISLVKDKMAGLRLGTGTRLIQNAIRRRIPEVVNDTYLTPYLQRMIRMVGNGALLARIAAAEGTSSP